MGWLRWNASPHPTEGHAEACRCGGKGTTCSESPSSEQCPRIVPAYAYMYIHSFTHSSIHSFSQSLSSVYYKPGSQ